MPSSRHAWMIRRAISPRLAMRIFLNMPGRRAAPTRTTFSRHPDREQRLSEFDRLGVLGVDLGDEAVDVALDLVHQLHRLDDAEHLALAHARADLDEGGHVRRGG